LIALVNCKFLDNTVFSFEEESIYIDESQDCDAKAEYAIFIEKHHVCLEQGEVEDQDALSLLVHRRIKEHHIVLVSISIVDIQRSLIPLL